MGRVDERVEPGRRQEDKRTMTPRRYAIGLTVTIAAGIAFYSWVFLRILRLPVEWVIPVMAGVTVILAVSCFHGYRRWLSAQGVPAQPADSAGPKEISTATVMSFMLVIAASVWTALYLLWQDFRIAGLGMVIAAGLLAVWTIRYLVARSAPGAQSTAAEGAFDLRALKAILIVIYTAILLNIGIRFLWRDPGVALLVLVASAILMLLGIRAIRRDYSRRH